MASNNSAYRLQWLKVKRRDGKILRLKGTIESLKKHIEKIHQRSYQRKKRVEELTKRLYRENQSLRSIKKFIDTPFEKRSYNALDYFFRLKLVTRELAGHISQTQLMILIYLQNIETTSSKNLKAVLGLTTSSVRNDVYELAKSGYLISKQINGLNNYMYITEEGKKAVKTFLDLMAKAKQLK